jgi:hypothetical protein
VAISSKRHVEEVVQHEGQPFGRREHVEDGEQGQPDRVGQFGLGRGVVADRRRPSPGDGLVGAGLEWLLPPRAARSQHVQRDAGHDRRQPAAEVLDVAAVGPGQPQPRLLDGVLGITRRAEHPVGHRPQARPVGLELPREPVVRRHRCHIPPCCRVSLLTGEGRRM